MGVNPQILNGAGPPIAIHLNRLQRNARHRLEHSARQAKKSCKTIADKLRGARGRKKAAVLTPGSRKAAWATPLTRPYRRPPTPIPPWRELTEEQKASIEKFAVETKTHTKATKDLQEKEWQRS